MNGPSLRMMEKENVDGIGNTLFSKTWLLQLLMRVLRQVKDVDPSSEDILELDADLEEQLCIFWDITVDRDMLPHLRELNLVEVFSSVLASARFPRLTEISLGILANLVYDKELCRSVSENQALISTVLCLLGSRDAPTLCEVCRLIQTAVASSEHRDVWVAAIHFQADVLENLVFILSYSSNVPLLNNCLRLIEVVTREDDALAELWCGPQLLQAAYKALPEISEEAESSEVFDRLCYTFTTNVNGARALVGQFGPFVEHAAARLGCLAEEQAHLLALAASHNSLRAILPVLQVLVSNCEAGDVCLYILEPRLGLVPRLGHLALACRLQSGQEEEEGVWLDLRGLFRELLEFGQRHGAPWLSLLAAPRLRAQAPAFHDSDEEEAEEESRREQHELRARIEAFVDCVLAEDCGSIYRRMLIEQCNRFHVDAVLEVLTDDA